MNEVSKPMLGPVIGLVLVTHGRLADEFVTAMEHVVGPQGQVRTVAIGEVGLLGELRPVAGLERRLREAARLGFEAAIVPPPGRGGSAAVVDGLRIVEVATLRDAIAAGLVDPAPPRGDALSAMLG